MDNGSETGKLPNIDVFYKTAVRIETPQGEEKIVDNDAAEIGAAITEALNSAQESEPECAATLLQGWWHWTRFPGCQPESEAEGPFSDAEEAWDDALEEASTETVERNRRLIPHTVLEKIEAAKGE